MNTDPFNTRFLDFIKTHDLFSHDQKLLVGVSGGVDSMVLCHLLKTNKFKFEIAHANFQLRGEDSKHDEEFVQEYAQRHSIGFHSQTFNTLEYSRENKVSIEMAARELRFNWFDELAESNNFDKIVLAHHLNDSFETSLLNFVKGTGIKGLHGILPERNSIVRPLLGFTKNEIVEFARAQMVQFVEDKTNLESDFQRNRVRNRVIPQLRKVNPNLERTFVNTNKNFIEAENFIENQIENILEPYKTNNPNGFEVLISELKKINYLEFILFQTYQSYGFSRSNINDLASGIREERTNLKFYSNSHQLILDRKQLILQPKEDIHEFSFLIDSFPGKIVSDAFELCFNIVENSSVDDLKNPEIAYLDYAKLELPLKVRNWEKGDYFHPFGMSNRKKVSDFFTDEKVEVLQKSKVPLVFSGSKLCWVGGFRIDNRFRISEDSKKVLKIVITSK